MKLTLQELADLTGGKIIRSGAVSEFSGMASLNEADQDEVSFLGNDKYHQDYLNTSSWGRLDSGRGLCGRLLLMMLLLW